MIIPTSRNSKRALYAAIHYWLKYNYGRANKCKNKSCLRKSKNFDWALIKGKKYDYKRTNFIQLCHSCHRKYDITDKFRKLMWKVNQNRLKTYCKYKHPYSDENTYKYKNYRQCRICQRKRRIKWNKPLDQLKKEIKG